MLDHLVTSLRAGRLGRASFVWAVLGLTALTALAVWQLGFAIVTPIGWPLILLWLWATSLRLRDMGRPLWTLAVPMLGSTAVAVVGGFLAMIGLVVAGESDGLGIGAVGGLIGLLAAAVVWIAFAAWLLFTPSGQGRRE